MSWSVRAKASHSFIQSSSIFAHRPLLHWCFPYLATPEATGDDMAKTIQPALKRPASAEKEQIIIRSRARLRAWLSKNHRQKASVWLVRQKKHTAWYTPNDDVVQEALAWGWIDSTIRKLDEGRFLQLLSPRRKGSVWSAKNKNHVKALESAGLMQSSGREKVEAATKKWFLDSPGGCVPLGATIRFTTSLATSEGHSRLAIAASVAATGTPGTPQTL